MNNILKLLILLFLFSTALFAENKKIKIAIPNDMMPYAFVEENNIASGILVDFWRLWAKKNNQEIEFVPSNWRGTLDALNNKEVHIHSGLFKNNERAEFLEYLEPIYRSESHIYFNRELEEEIKSVKDIDNRTIAIEDGSYYESYFKKNYPKVKVKKYGTFSEMFDALENREVELIIEDSLVIQRYLMKNSIYNRVNILPSFELNKWFYSAIKKDDKNLKELVSKGFKNISSNDLIELEKKWAVKDRFGYSQKNKNDVLTFEERIWLLNNKDVTLAIVKDWIRYSYIDHGNKLKGFHLDLIEQINKNLNTNIKYRAFKNWTEAYPYAKEGKVDGILGLSWSKEREEFFNYSPSYHYAPYYIVTQKENNDIYSLSDFNRKIAVTSKNAISNEIIKEKAPLTKIIHNEEGILDALVNKKADVAILENAKEIDLDKYGLKIVDDIYSKYSEFFIGTSKKKEIFHKIIKKGIESISKEQMKVLKDRWLNKKIVFSKKELDYVKNSPILIVGIEDWPGIMGSKDGKILEGLGGELVQKALNISGLELEFVQSDWNDLLNRFKEGEIDILPTTAYTKQRDEYGDFTDKYLSMKNYIYVKSDNNSISSLSDLENKKLALQRGFNTITFIKELYPNIKIVETHSLEESIQKVLNGEVDALFELQIAVQNKMKEQLITNLKSVSQNSIKTQSLHMFFNQGDELLKSILNKSLALIPDEEKNSVISKWLYDFDVDKDVNVAFGLGRDPYILDKNFMKGIEYDLVNKILNLSSINIKNKKNISIEEIKNIFKTDKDIDIAVSVKEEKNSALFYSDVFMEFENVVVSRKKDNLKITSVKDLASLKDKKVVGFLDAYKYLGDEYFNLYNLNNRPNTYSEVSFQEDQVRSFLEKETDLIVLDKNIFKWFFYQLSKDNISNYSIHYIFPNNNAYKVAFKDKNLRDVFNKNLKHIRQTGDYKEIFNNYTEGYITSKVKINSLISLVVGKFIFNRQIDELKKVLDIFLALPYIKKIEIFNIENELLVNSTKEDSKRFILTDTYHFIDNLPQKVGFIKVYFDNKLIKEYENSSLFIPSIKKFENLDSFEFIKDVYRKFAYINSSKIAFTKEELDFIKKKRVVTFSNLNWEPMNIVQGDTITGLFPDYIKLIENRTGLEFKFETSQSWSNVLEKFRANKLDIIPNIGDIAFTFKNGVVSNRAVRFKYAIVSSQEGTYLDGLKELKGKTVALPKGYSSNVLIKNNYPNIKIVEVKSVDEALKKVSKNEVDAFVGHSAISIHKIQNSFPDLKIIGLSEEYFNHYILIQDKYPELLSIINKVISSITAQERQKIRDKWIRTEVSTAIDYSILYRMLAVFFIILAIVLAFTKKLSSAKKEIEVRNKKIEETLIDLEEQKNVFETLFNDTSDGFSLIKDGKFIDCNNSVLEMLACEKKEEFLNLEPHEISPAYQYDGQKSEDKEKIVIDKCLKEGSNRFEWVHRKVTGEDFWVEVVLTKIVLNNEDIIHVVWRDIKDKKILEKQILDRNHELEDSNHELEVSIQNLKQTQDQLIESEKMASLAGLVAGVAHEINTPVGIGYTGATHLIDITSNIKKAYKEEEMTQENFEEYLSTSDELAHLISLNLGKAANLVKSFKQVAVDQTSEEKRTFNLKTYIDENLASINSVLKKTNLEVDVICAHEIIINSYPGAISQVLTNLIMNSIIHGYEENEKGTLSIEVIKSNSHIEIVYKDDGKGIPKENLSKVFDPFFTTNREKGGSGLGLNIIYNIVTSKLGGRITCVKNVKKGVEFRIEFNI